jgi:hypothetical protein
VDVARYLAEELDSAPDVPGFRGVWPGEAPPILLDSFWPGGEVTAAAARVGHFGGRVYVQAEIPDSSVCTSAVRENERLWEKGDVFEMFFQVAGCRPYFEFHVSPNNLRLQLRVPGRENFDRSRFDEYLLPPGSFQSVTEVGPGRWALLAVFDPATLGAPALLKSQIWRFSFCRYDADQPGGEARLSSSSRHAELDFHRVHEWNELEFV